MNTTQMYDAQAGSIRVEDIASIHENAIVLRRIQRNDPNDKPNLWIQDQHDYDGEECIDYVPERADAVDMGWLGYFVGKSDHLNTLSFRPFTPPSGTSFEEVIEPFLIGLSNNKSITQLDFDGMDLLDGDIFNMLGPFLENNPNLVDLAIDDCDLGAHGCRALALAIGSSKHKSLTHASFEDCNISGEALVDIITALSMHPRLQNLQLNGNRIRGANVCITLATLLRHSCTTLESLNLANNEINDEGIDALVPALKNCSSLHQLRLSSNPSITSRGWQKLATVLESPNSNLKTLRIESNNVDDVAVAEFARSLMNNCTMTTLNIDNNASITDEGSKVLSKLLCDTSSVNSTFLSNHTLSLGNISDENPLQSLLELNENEDKKEVAMIKILQHHNEFDMMPFFEWEFKALPLIIDWFDRASSISMPDNFPPNIGPRKLSSIYQFVRGMPLMYVETRLRKELEDIKAAQIHIEEEQARLDQQKQLNEERKRGILERLGRNV